MYQTTVGELGFKLPIGILDGKKLKKDFALRPYKSVIDRHLADWAEVNQAKLSPGPFLAGHVAKFLGLIVSEIGGKAITVTSDRNSAPETELQVYSWFLADVIQILIAARIAALGQNLEVPIACPKCKHEGRGVFDLNSITVNVLEDKDQIERWVSISRPFPLRDGTPCRKVKVRPLRWSAMAKPGVMSGNQGSVNYASLEDAICAVNGKEDEYSIVPSEIDEIERVDVVSINRGAGRLQAGADLETRIVCPGKNKNGDPCDHTFVDPLRWSHDHFFGSSVPQPEPEQA